MAIKLFYLDDLTNLNKLNLPTIPQDKEVELNIKLKACWYTTIKVKVPPLYITSEPEPVCCQCSRLYKNALPV